MDSTLLLTLASLAVSLLSALYARWAVTEAKKANKIAKLEKRIEIYRAFDALRFSMLREGCRISHNETSILYQAARESEFHFPLSISKKLTDYHHTCFELAEINNKIKRPDINRDQLQSLRNEQDKLLDEEEKLAKELNKLIREELSDKT